MPEISQMTAEDRIRKVRIQFLREKPFFAHLSLYLNLIERKDFDTMGVDFEGGLIFNPKFVNSFNFTDLKMIIAHETCLVPETFVWNKKINEIKVGDKILGDDGKEHKVILTNERKYEGELICITPRGSLPIKITPNHPVLTTNGLWKGFQKPNYRKLKNRVGENEFIFEKLKWKNADELTENDWLVIPKIKPLEKYENYVIKFSYGNVWSTTLKKSIREGLKLDEDIAYFLGLYTADGWANIKSKTIGICLHSKKDIEKIEKIKKIIENKMGFKVNIKKRTDSNCFDVKFSSRPFVSFLHENIGTRAWNKKIPEFIIFNNDEIKKAFLKGFIDGDGYNNHINIGFATISENLAHQLFMLSASLGIIFNMYKERRNTKKGLSRLNKINKEWTDIYIFFSRCHKIFDVLNLPHKERTIRKTKWFKEYEDYILIKIRKIQREKYDGLVFNLQTENQNYISNNIVVHNCHLAFLHMTRRGNRIPLLWNIACFTPNMILSGNFSPIGNIIEKNNAISKDGVTNIIKGTTKREYNGNIYKIKAVGIKEIEATPEHPFLVLKRKNTYSPIRYEEKMEWINAENLNKNCYLVMPKIKGNIKVENLDLIKYAKETQRFGHNIKNKKIPLNNETAWLMGLYVAEGCSSGKCSFRLCLGFDDKKYLKKIYEINDKFLKTKIQKREMNKNIDLNFSSSLLQRAFENWFGRGAKNKKIPDFIMYNENKKIIEHFLEGYIDGDGCRHKHGTSNVIMIGTASEKLALQIQLLLTRLNIFSKFYIHRKKERCIKNQKLPKQILYEVSWIIGFNKLKRILNRKKIESYNYKWRDKGDYFVTPIRKIEKVKYNGFVYNIETETHTYLINNIAVHNCDLAVNNILYDDGFHIPEGFLMNRKYKDMTAEQIYDDLYKSAKHIKMRIGGICKKCSDGTQEVDFNDTQGKMFDKHSFPKRQDNGAGRKNSKGSERDGKESEKDKDDTKGEPLSDDELKKLQDLWKKRIVEAETIAKQMGKLPANLERMFGNLLDSRINWKALLYRYITQEIPYDSTYARPSKKSESVGVYLPYQVKENIEIVIGIDSSGSITQEELTDFMSEMVAIAKSFASIKMTVITCDSEIHEIYEVMNGFSPTDIKISGGGGTDAKPILKWIEKNKPYTKLWIYLTDGYTELNIPNSYKSLWVITNNGSISNAEDIAQRAGNITCLKINGE